MKTRSREYPSVTESSSTVTTSNSTSKKVCDSAFTFNSNDSSSSSDFELIIEREKKMVNYSDTEEYYDALVEKVRMMFTKTTAGGDAANEHRAQDLIVSESFPKLLEFDVMESSDEANFSKFKDDINMSRAMFNATSTPVPESSINYLHTGNILDISEENNVIPQIVSPVKAPSHTPYASEHNTSKNSDGRRHNDSDKEEVQNIRFDDKVNTQSDNVEDSICNETLDKNISQIDDEMSSATHEESNESKFEENCNYYNFSNKYLSNNSSGAESLFEKVATIFERNSDASSSLSLNLDLYNISDFVDSPILSLENILSDIQCRSGYNSPTRISKGSIHNVSNEMEIQKVPFIGNVHIQLDEIENYEDTIVTEIEPSLQGPRVSNVVVEENKITSAKSFINSNDLNTEQSTNYEEEQEEEMSTTKSKELNEVTTEQSTNFKEEQEEEITTTKSKELNEVNTEQSTNDEEEQEEEMSTTKSKELNEVTTEQSTNFEEEQEEEITTEQSTNFEEEQEEEITTTKSKELNEVNTEQSTNFEEEQEEEITTTKSKELNEVNTEQSTNFEEEQEEEITTTKSKELNEVNTKQSTNYEEEQEEGMTTTKSKELKEVNTEQSTNYEEEQKEEITTTKSEELNIVNTEQSTNFEEEHEEEITTTKSKELNEVNTKQSTNCEEEQEEEITTTKSKELNEGNTEQSSNCEDVKEEDEITNAKSKELNEVLNEQSAQCADDNSSGETGDGSNITSEGKSNTGINIEVPAEKVKTLLKRKSVAVQTDSISKRTKTLNYVKNNFFIGDLQVFSINII